ncbi:hypothetical protein [Pseudonocardia sp. H11422]|uniref:hypothetical protein n=1 Tax=Pseudonocardia sp. H11422 TaxID=2835866 RepID=UPI001BDBF2D4|nr:hypothetical protein [Pseudonocardia sp. H11422]
MGKRARQPRTSHQDTYVDYDNDDRRPLLFIAGTEDHLMPPKVQWSNAKHYKSDSLTEVVEFGGRAHLLPAQAGWEEIVRRTRVAADGGCRRHHRRRRGATGRQRSRVRRLPIGVGSMWPGELRIARRAP